MAAADSSPLHIVIFPWLAFGHLIPGLEFAERLAEHGQRVSFVSTQGILRRLRPVAPALASLIDLVALPFPRIDGLPDGAEATSDLPPGTAELHVQAMDRLAPAFSAFLGAACADGSDRKVDWVLLDNFHASMADVASEHKVLETDIVQRNEIKMIPCTAVTPFPCPAGSLHTEHALLRGDDRGFRHSRPVGSTNVPAICRDLQEMQSHRCS
jgi:hypothetical protein